VEELKISMAKERRRKYFPLLVEEVSLLFGVPKPEATVFAERFVLYMSAKVKAGDKINFGDGCFAPRTLPPRTFNLISGGGPTGRQKTFYGERVRWKLNLFKRAKVSTT